MENGSWVFDGCVSRFDHLEKRSRSHIQHCWVPEVKVGPCCPSHPQYQLFLALVCWILECQHTESLLDCRFAVGKSSLQWLFNGGGCGCKVRR